MKLDVRGLNGLIGVIFCPIITWVHLDDWIYEHNSGWGETAFRFIGSCVGVYMIPWIAFIIGLGPYIWIKSKFIESSENLGVDLEAVYEVHSISLLAGTFVAILTA